VNETVKVLSTMCYPLTKNYDEIVNELSLKVPEVNFDFMVPVVPGKFYNPAHGPITIA
jgi:hypothetical protein